MTATVNQSGNHVGNAHPDIPSGSLDHPHSNAKRAHPLFGSVNVSIGSLVARTWNSLLEDRLFGHAAELGFYFLFALFPTLLSASSILGLAAQSAHQFYARLLDYLAILIPTSALGTVLKTFNETTSAATSGKITFGLIAAIWSASVGISAVQGTLNEVYNIPETRSFVTARIHAIGLTILLSFLVTIALASLLGGDVAAVLVHRFVHYHLFEVCAAVSVRIVAWSIATLLLALCFAVVYNWAPDLKRRSWRWVTPGSAFGIVGWLTASLGLRLYLHFFNSYSITYGSLGAVIILLTWFYITGLMLLVGAEINSELDAIAGIKYPDGSNLSPVLAEAQRLRTRGRTRHG